MDNETRASLGESAIEAGTCDQDTIETDATDAIANVLHCLHQQDIDPADIIRSAIMHFEEESGQTVGNIDGPGAIKPRLNDEDEAIIAYAAEEVGGWAHGKQVMLHQTERPDYLGMGGEESIDNGVWIKAEVYFSGDFIDEALQEARDLGHLQPNINEDDPREDR